MNEKDNLVDQLDLDEYEDLGLNKLSMKKSVSTPPPGFHNFSYPTMSQNLNQNERKYEETKEFQDYLNQYKKFNPRIAEFTINKFYSTLEETSSQLKPSTSNKIKINYKNDDPMPFSPIVNEKKNNDIYYNQNIRNNEDFNFGKEEIYGYSLNNSLNNEFQNYNLQNMSFNIYNSYVIPSNLTEYQDRSLYKYKNLNESKKIQNEYENGDEFQKEKIFQYALNNMLEMIFDTYNNYIIQKIFEKGCLTHKKELLNKLKTNFVKVTLHKFGCRIIQKTIDAFPSPISNEYKFIQTTIFENINTFVWNENANLVILKCLEKYNGQDFLLFLRFINEKFNELSIHKTGCLTLQKLADVYFYKDSNLKKEINEVILQVISQSYDLSKKEYSNYIIQHLLEAGHPDHREKLLYESVLNNFVSLSSDQYASNVSEKAVINSDKDFRKKLWEDVFRNKDSVFTRLVNDKYGNYVMQRIYEYSEIEQKKEFIEQINKIKNSLNPQGQYVLKFVLNNINFNIK